MKMFSITYRKSESISIYASFDTPKGAKKWMDEMLAQHKAVQQNAKMTAEEAFDKAFEKGRKIGWRKGFQDCQKMHSRNKAAVQQSTKADGLTICQNCGSWLRAGECENCNSPFAADAEQHPAANANRKAA